MNPRLKILHGLFLDTVKDEQVGSLQSVSDQPENAFRTSRLDSLLSDGSLSIVLSETGTVPG